MGQSLKCVKVTTLGPRTLYLCIISILLDNMYSLISYATCEWPEMYSFNKVMFCSVLQHVHQYRRAGLFVCIYNNAVCLYHLIILTI